jgi:uncharacterized protein
VRLALTAGGSAVFDPERRRGGRGAYVHRNHECLLRSLKRGGLARAFRARVDSAPDGLES